MNNLVSYINTLSIDVKSLILGLILLVLVLIILVIVLIVKVSSNKKNSPFIEEEKIASILNIDDIEDNKKEEKEVARKIEMPKEVPNTKPQEKFDISKTTKKMQEDINNENIDLTDFEIEQEEKSIISYKELLAKVGKDKSVREEVNTKMPKVEISDISNNEDIKYTRENRNKSYVDKDYTFSTEVIDFEKEIKNSRETKNENKATILNIDKNDYSHNDFLKSLKNLKDNLG